MCASYYQRNKKCDQVHGTRSAGFAARNGVCTWCYIDTHIVVALHTSSLSVDIIMASPLYPLLKGCIPDIFSTDLLSLHSAICVTDH
jgi:hypothetical protein